ncbi:hypothetical protein ACWN8V_07630 [Vagococcus elongatus]|uniref:Uncharacterized protein n=1 Tax=Vagococcus elongatus TaxID=180344 RepID=A0A430AU37_9ENTE|nr:hypothetical protein [Vagococcus elongatus]RSU11572.1 hypothetical protein CBF29_07780 [Vagococcus elongatus]
MNTYLAEEEYKKMGFAEISDPFSFRDLLFKAGLILDNITRDYYQFVSFNDDHEWRVKKFKQAVGLQIEYFMQNEANSTSQLNDRPMNVTIGRTTISRGGKAQTVEGSEVTLLCPDVQMVLEGTGLLFRGVS